MYSFPIVALGFILGKTEKSSSEKVGLDGLTLAMVYYNSPGNLLRLRADPAIFVILVTLGLFCHVTFYSGISTLVTISESGSTIEDYHDFYTAVLL